ncbi:MAG: hypothetical protein WAN36_11070, partial [Calditrichia bacterium]
MKIKIILLLICIILPGSSLFAQTGTIPKFQLQQNDLQLQRLAQPHSPFNKVGHKFAVLGQESGSFEAWAYPLKLFRNFEFSFLLANSTTPVKAADLVRYISVSPEASTLTYTFQSFTVKAIFVTPPEQPGAFIFLDIESTVPLTLVCGFLPVMQPMWPAGIGGQYAYWNKDLNAYIISESGRQNHGIIGSPAAAGISATPAHMLSDAPNEFKIEITDPEKVSGELIPIVMAGGRGERDSVIAVYQRLLADPEKYYRKTYEYYQQLRQNTARISTPVKELDLAFEWAKV